MLIFATHSQTTSNGVSLQSGEVVVVGKRQKVQRRRRQEVEDEQNPSSLPNPYWEVFQLPRWRIRSIWELALILNFLNLKYCQTKRQIAVNLLRSFVASRNSLIKKRSSKLEMNSRKKEDLNGNNKYTY
nr:hypothetical protein [Tanacetum cinerariifolium]